MGSIPTGASHAENAQCILAVPAGILNQTKLCVADTVKTLIHPSS